MPEDIASQGWDLTRMTDPLTIGMHRLKIEHVEENVAGPKHPYDRVQFSCADNGAEFGKRISDIFSHSPEARFRVEPFFDALSLPKTGRIRLLSQVGKYVRVEVIHEDYEGRTQARVRRYLKDTPGTDLSPSDLAGKASTPSVASLLGGVVPTPKVDVADIAAGKK